MVNPNERLIKRLKSQIAVAKEVDGDFVYMTVGDAKRVLKLLEPDQKRAEKRDELLKNFEKVRSHCDSVYSPCVDFYNTAYDIFIYLEEEQDDENPHRD